MKSLQLVLAVLVLIASGASAGILVLPERLIQAEGENIRINCSVGAGETRLNFQLFVGGTEFTQTGKNVNSGATDTGTFFEYGPLIRSENGLAVMCQSSQGTNSSTLIVACKCDRVALFACML